MNKDEVIDLLTKVQALLQQLAPIGTTDDNQRYADLCFDCAAKLAGLIGQLQSETK